jgi:hypothetical protein
MTVMVTGEFISFADDDGGYCGTGVIEEIIAWLRHHPGGGGGGGGNGDPIIRVKLSEHVRGELEELSQTLIETSQRFEQVVAGAVREHERVGR